MCECLDEGVVEGRDGGGQHGKQHQRRIRQLSRETGRVVVVQPVMHHRPNTQSALRTRR